MAKSQLPVLPLPYPVVLLPASRFTMPVSRETGDAILEVMEQSDVLPVVAAVPVSNQDEKAPVYSEWATATRILRLVRPPTRNIRQPYLVSLHGLARVRLRQPFDGALLSHKEVQYASTDPRHDPSPQVIEKFKDSALRLLDRLAEGSKGGTRRERYSKIAGLLDELNETRAPWMADVLVSSLTPEYTDKLAILAAYNPTERLELATDLFMKQASISEVSKKIESAVDESLSNQQKEFFLRQQLAAIQKELQTLNNGRPSGVSTSPVSASGSTGSELDNDEQAEHDDMAEIKHKIEAMDQGSEERKAAVREWRKLRRGPPGGAEQGVIRTYLDWLTSLPWNGTPPSTGPTSTSAFLANARSQLDSDHFGLDKIKKRLIEYLAVVRLKELNERLAEATNDSQPTDSSASTEQKALVPRNPDTPLPSPPRPKRRGAKGPILLFVGPPGTGKTSLGQSIAKALDRPFQRVSLGGVRDEAEIRGHRRTYVASGPGLVVQALRKAGRRDPVLLLDEIDKVGHSNFHGDPSAALLEVLDPEQNNSFNDHYVNVPIDLSQVLFICTANTLDTISPPLLDRCEVIQLAGYTYDEKIHIARRFLLPKQLDNNGLSSSNLIITDPAMLNIATEYTREAGVRSLERAIGGVVRYKAVEWAQCLDSENGKPSSSYIPIVTEHDLESILGIARWDGDEKDREERIGLVYGLVVMGQGEGGIMPVETAAVPGQGSIKLTGSLGEVIKESAELALSWVKTHAYSLGITETRFQDPLKVPEPLDVHLHLPAGAQKKDGPSAGVAMTCAFVSLLTGVCVPTNVAMTGEITLRGHVTPVGGVKEKVLGAHRAKMTRVILPWANRKDVEHDVAKEVQKDMEFVFVKTLAGALEAAFGSGRLAWRRNARLIESRL